MKEKMPWKKKLICYYKKSMLLKRTGDVFVLGILMNPCVKFCQLVENKSNLEIWSELVKQLLGYIK